MAGLEETLALDYTDALSGADALEDRLTDVARSVEAALSEAFTGALGDAEALGELVGESVAKSIADGAQAGVDQVTDSLAELEADVAVSVDDSAVQDLAAVEDIAVAVSVDDSELQELAVEDITVGASVDTDDLDAFAATVEELDGQTVAVDVQVDDTAVDEAATSIDALADTTIDVGVVVDTTGVDQAGADVSALDGQAIGIDVQVETSGLDDAASQVGGFTDGMSDASAGAQEFGAASQDASEQSGGFADALGGVSEVLGEVAPGFSAATVGAAAFAATIGLAIGEAITAESSALRLERAFGDSVGTATEYDDALTGVVGSLEDLAVATGSSDDDLKFLIARFGETGQTLGFTREETAKAAASYAQLALFVAATRPELGSAEVVAGKLARALATGGRFASDMGIPLASAGEIAEVAAEKFGKPIEALTQYEKQVAGLELATSRLGPAIGQGIAAGTEDPIVKLRSLQTAIGEAIEAAGQPLVGPFIDSLERLGPVIEDVIGVVGNLGAGAVGPLAAAIGGALSVLEVFADVLASIPAPAIAAAGAFLTASKGASLLLPLLLRITPALRSVATSIGAVGTAGRFDGLVAQFRGAERAVAGLTAKTAAAKAVNDAYTAALVTQAVNGNAAATLAIRAHTVAVEADSAVLTANAAVNSANLRVKAAEAAVSSGQVGAELQLVAAREAQQVALAGLAGAEQRATVARAQSTAAGEVAVASARSNAAELAALSAATTTNAAATANAATSVTLAGSAAGGASALLGPLSILLGVGAAAWALWGSQSKEATEDLDASSEALADYTEQLGLTNTELANLDTADARDGFLSSAAAADKFFEALEEADLGDQFNDLRLNLSTAGEAINGSREQVEAFRRELVRTGAVDFTFTTGGMEQTIDETSDAYQTLLDQYVETGEVQSSAIASNGRYEVSLEGVGQAFEDQVEAAAGAREAVLAEAEAELTAANAADTNAIAQLAATGQLAELGREGEIAARVLLEQSDAQEQAAETATAFEVAASAATDATGRLIEAAGRAATAFAEGDAINTSDLGAARALAASDAFDDLPQEVQDSVSSLVDFADAEIETANASGELISSLGEVATSLVELQDELDQAVDKFDALRGAQGRFNAEQRDIASGIRGIDDQVDDLGASLDDQGASFDTAAINAANYTDYLSLLSDEQRKVIEDAKVPDLDKPKRQEFEDGSSRGPGDKFFQPTNGFEERGLNDAEKAEAVRRAIQGSADAMGRANDEAKDNADSLLDYFDTVTGKIAEAGQEAIARGENVGDVNARVAAQIAQFRDAAIAAGVAEGAVDEYLATVGLNPVTGFSQDQLDTSGITNAVSDLERLQTVIGFLPESVRLRIEAETDPEAQRQLIEESLQTLGPEFAVQVDTYLAAITPEEASAALAAIQTSIERLPAVALALGLQIDPNLDPAAQVAEIQRQIGFQSANTQVEIRTFLQAPTPEEADFALAVLANRTRAIQILMELTPLTEDQSTDALRSIQQFNDNADNELKLKPTIETVQLVADVNTAAAQALAQIPVELNPEDRDAAVAEIEAQRRADLTVIADTGKANTDIDALTAQAQTQEVNVNIEVPGWAKWIVGFPGAKPPAARVGVTVEPTVGGGGDDGGGEGGPAARVIRNVGGFFSGLFGQRGGTTVPEVQQYATGGARVDPRILRRLREQDGGLDQVGAPEPGRYGPGQYVTFAEDGTAGEYLISRKATERPRNQELVRTAAADLGVQLAAPQVSVAAPQVSVAAPGTDPMLLDAVRRLARAQARPARTTTIAPGAIVVNETRDARRTADKVSSKFVAESFLQGDI